MAKPAKIAPESVYDEPTPPPTGGGFRSFSGPAAWLDERVGVGKIVKFGLRKVFPDHWSFLLGEIALYSFIVLLLTGVFLTLWFKPSMAEIEYGGTYQMMRGLPMSEAFASTLEISFDVRGGLLIRQIHHWAAILFMAALTAHMLRVFFTGAFRKPRELNWLIGVGLMSIGMIAGMTGYSLPDDLLSGTGLRFADGLIRSIPIVGTWLEFFVFGGEFPGGLIISRFYIAHVLLLPGVILGLISAHLAMLVYHKHTQFPGPGRTESNVVGYPLFPVYMAKAGGFFFIVFGVLVLMGATMSINPVWLFGPYNPAQVTAGSQPDWYLGWVEGAVRIMPGWESHWGPTTWSWNVFVPGVLLMGLLFTGLGAYPFIERWINGDDREHHLLDRPRDVPNRTALGVAGMTCYGLFWIAGGNDIVATHFKVSLNAVTYFMRVAVFVGPVIAFIVTKRICLALQRMDRERLLHGSESGVIMRSPEGGYSEPHVEVGHDEAWTISQQTQYQPLHASAGVDADGMPAPDRKIGPLRARLSRWYYAHDIPLPTRDELESAHHHGADHAAEENPPSDIQSLDRADEQDRELNRT